MTVEETRRRELVDAVGSVMAGSECAPDGDAVLTEAVVVMVWMQTSGEMGLSWVGANHAWSTEGMLRDVLRRLESGTDAD